MKFWLWVVWQGLMVIVVVACLGFSLFQLRTSFEIDHTLEVIHQECDHMRQDAAWYDRCDEQDALSDRSFYRMWLANTRMRVVYGVVAIVGSGLILAAGFYLPRRARGELESSAS